MGNYLPYTIGTYVNCLIIALEIEGCVAYSMTANATLRPTSVPIPSIRSTSNPYEGIKADTF